MPSISGVYMDLAFKVRLRNIPEGAGKDAVSKLFLDAGATIAKSAILATADRGEQTIIDDSFSVSGVEIASGDTAKITLHVLVRRLWDDVNPELAKESVESRAPHWIDSAATYTKSRTTSDKPTYISGSSEFLKAELGSLYKE